MATFFSGWSFKWCHPKPRLGMKQGSKCSQEELPVPKVGERVTFVRVISMCVQFHRLFMQIL